jgi:uncharacterized protein (TIGR02594 family)
MSVDLIPELIPWAVLLLVFFGMVAMQWRVINALDQALARLSPLPAPPVRQPVPVTALPPRPAPPALAPPVVVPPPAPAPIPVPIPPAPVIAGPFGTAPAWFQWALHEIGFHETGNNGGIERYISLAHTGSVGDPWCAIFANAALEASGIAGTRSASSQSFRSNPGFIQLSGPALGAITVYWRGTQSSGLGHVGFYRGENASSIWTLGGNENDMVQIEALTKSSGSFGLIGYWWPKSVPLPVVGPVLMPVGSATSVQVPPVPSTPARTGGPGRQIGITATMFGSLDSGKYQSSAYGGPIIDTSPGVALPFHFPGVRPRVVVYGKNGASIACDIVDVGPWNTNDPYWETGSRPEAESGTDLGQASNSPRKTNKAGIDLTLAAAQAVGVDGKGLVDWEFITGPSTPQSVV